jgi:hypothetical protein
MCQCGFWSWNSEPDAVTMHSECAAYPPLPSTSPTRSKSCLIDHRSILNHGPVQSPSPAFSVDRQLCLIPRVREVEFVTQQLVIDFGANRTQSAGNWNRNYIAANDLLLRCFLTFQSCSLHPIASVTTSTLEHASIRF